MAERHDDLRDGLGPAETAAFEALFTATPRFDVPAGLGERVFAAIAPQPRRRRWRRLVMVLVPAAAAAAVAVVVALSGGEDVERYALLGGGAQVSASVRTTGVGRAVTVRIDRLRDPRPAGLYELWFVAPDDRRGRPHRVSAGTFHPDDAGGGTVHLLAAADPKTYTAITVTLEPADGNPRRQGPTVLRARRTR
jgi:anti-sigma-K factor RskA